MRAPVLGPKRLKKKIEMGVKNACDLGDLDTYIYIYCSAYLGRLLARSMA